MKYLKPFNESTENFQEDLQEFCEMNLAYLLDDAELQIVPSPGGWHELHLIRILLNEPKRWNEIKDHMIPFLTRLVSKYEISNQPFRDLNTWTAKKDPITEFEFLIDGYKQPKKSILTKIKSFFK